MAADQRRKRLNDANNVGCSSREQHRTKRKNVGVTKNDLNMKSHISVRWDGHQKKVVAKREQIGISWRNMSPFVNSSHRNHNVLVDIFTVPTEIFGLNNLTDLLSYETWQHYLTENERNHLSQFLPRGSERDQVVQNLLDGENFHFGNPFLKWGASLCSGDYHPDAIFLQEKHLNSNKKLYYSELHRYHNDMIRYLMKWKEKWESCENPEMDFVKKLKRSGNGEEKRDSSHVYESRLPEEDVPATSESGSWVADERAWSSENQFSSLIKGEKQQKRTLEKDMRGVRGSSLFSSDDTINIGSAPKKGDKLVKHSVHSSDGAKYMSYIKITKRQLELVRSMKKAGQSIQVKSLNCVLSNLDGLHVQPYEVFVEEEQKNLHDHWLHLVTEDIPSAYAFWRERQMQIERMKNLMEEEILDKLKPSMEDENGSFGSDDLQDQEDGEEINDECTEGEYEGSSPRSAADPSPQEISSPSSADDLTPVVTNSEKNTATSRADDAKIVNNKYSSCLNAPDILVGQEVHASSGGNVWQTVGMPPSYYDFTGNHEYSSVNDFSIANPQINEEKESRSIDLEISMREEGTNRELLHGYPDGGSFISYADQERNNILQAHLEQKHLLQSHREENSPNQSHGESNNLLQAHQERNGLLECHQDHSNFLPSHQNQPDLIQPQQNQNDLLHSLFRDPGMLSHLDQNGTGLNFQRHADVMMDNSQLSGHFKDPLQPSLTLELEQKSSDDIFFGEHVSDDVYSQGGRFVLPRQGHLSSVNMPGWVLPHMSAPSQSQLNGAELLGQHWLPSNQVRGSWTGLDGATLPINSTGSGASPDLGMYSVLSQCSQLRSNIAYNSVRPSDQLITPGTYGVMDTLAPRINSLMPQTSHPLDFLSGRETGNSLVPDGMGWMSLPPQNSALHDQLGKPFLRSWNE